jgi:hypothetical protein
VRSAGQGALLQTTFDYEFRVAERRVGSRLLRRQLYPLKGANMVVVGVPIALAAIASLGRYLGWWEVSAQLVGMVAALLLLFVLRYGLARMMRSIVPPSVMANEGRRIRFEFSDDGYTMTSEFFEGRQRWPGVFYMIAGEGLILFVISDMAHILPDRTFATPEDRKAFLAWALDRLTPEARALSRV